MGECVNLKDLRVHPHIHAYLSTSHAQNSPYFVLFYQIHFISNFSQKAEIKAIMSLSGGNKSCVVINESGLSYLRLFFEGIGEILLSHSSITSFLERNS